MTNPVVATIDFASGGTVRVCLGTRKGERVVQLRALEPFSAAQVLMPSKEPPAFGPDDIPKLIAALGEARRLLKDGG